MKNTIKARNINPLSWEKRLHLAYATSLLKSGRVKSCEGLPEMIPTNNYLVLFYRQTKHFTQTYGSYIISNFNNFEHTNHIIKASNHHSIHD